jgi:glucuronate isomerase
MKFINEDFLLQTHSARQLYRDYAEPQPILDYHCHLPPKDIAEDRVFSNLFEIWLEGDHYKWRAMRANGVDERFCTGDAAPFEKFRAWAATVPHTLRNPLYHWTHLELQRYFGIHELLDEGSAARIWKEANAQLASGKLSAQKILAKFNVRTVCTTDDPADDLRWHRKLAASGCPARVYPAFRPDKALAVHQPAAFTKWLQKLREVSCVEIRALSGFLDALQKRHDYFHENGCRLSDHGLTQAFSDECTERQAAAIFARAFAGKPVSEEEHRQFASFMMLFFGTLDARRGWVKQLHLGALRNANTRRLAELGPDTGFDSIGDQPQASALATYLDRLESENALPRIIIYNANPADNYTFATIIGNFQDGAIAGKIQMGSGWWFLDQKEGMEWQLNALSNQGLLSRFVGMVTDSRSFMSYPRHEYFRRVLCNLIGRDVENGELPEDQTLLGTLIRNVCYGNAARHINWPDKSTASSAPRARRSR